MLGPIGPSCSTVLEAYGKGDGEKRACSLSQIARTAGRNCIIYSIGSNNMWEFEEDIFQRTTCRVETFDCTMHESIQPPEYIQSRVRLH